MKKPSLILLATFSVGFAANNTLNALVSAEGKSWAFVHNVSKNSDSSSKSTKDGKEEIKYNKSTKDFVKVLLITAPLCAFTFLPIAIVNKQLKLKSKETSEKSSEEKQQEVDKEEESEDNKEIVQKSNKKENNVIWIIVVISIVILILIYVNYYQSLKKELKNKLLGYGVEAGDEESGIDLLFKYLDIIFGYIGGIPSLRTLLEFNKLISLLEGEKNGIANFPKFFNDLDVDGIVNFIEILDNFDKKGIANFAKILHGLVGSGLENLVLAFNFEDFNSVMFAEKINSLKSEEDVKEFADNINNYDLFLLKFISEENFHDDEKYPEKLNIVNDIENDLINYDEVERKKVKYDKKLCDFYEATRNTNEEDIKDENFKIEAEHESFYKKGGNFESDLNEYIEKNEENKENKYNLEDLINNTYDWGKVIYL